MKTIIHQLLSILAVTSSVAYAEMSVSVRPALSNTQLIIQVSWSSLEGSLQGESSFEAYDSVTAVLLDDETWIDVDYVNYELVADDYSDFNTETIGVGDGFAGVKSYPEGYGMASYDYGNLGRDFYLFRTSNQSIPESGFVTFVIPTSAPPLSLFNTGSSSLHPNFNVSVENASFITPKPNLEIKKSNGVVELTWNASFPGSLYESPDLSILSWAPVTLHPVYTHAEKKYSITYTTLFDKRFFRLQER